MHMWPIHCLHLKYLNITDINLPCQKYFWVFVFMSYAKYRKIKCISKTHEEILFRTNIFLTLFVKLCHNISIYMKRVIMKTKNWTCKYSETRLKITLHSVSEMRNILLKSKAAFAHIIWNIFKRCCLCNLKQKHISKPQKAVVVIWPNVKQPLLSPDFDSYSLLQGVRQTAMWAAPAHKQAALSSAAVVHCVLTVWVLRNSLSSYYRSFRASKQPGNSSQRLMNSDKEEKQRTKQMKTKQWWLLLECSKVTTLIKMLIEWLF